MVRKSLSELAHPGRPCLSCSKCKKSKKDDPRNFHHIISWPDHQKVILKEQYNIQEDSCLCDSCRQDIKRSLGGHVSQGSRKKERPPCFLHVYARCENASLVDTPPGTWAEFATKLSVHDCPAAALPPTVPLCQTHYNALRTKPRCAHCQKIINDRNVRTCTNFDAYNKLSEDLGAGVILNVNSPLCQTCYTQTKHLIARTHNEISLDDDLQKIVQEQKENAEKSYHGDMQTFATASMIAQTGEFLLTNKPIHLKEVCEFYHKKLGEAYHRRGYAVPDSQVKTHQSVMMMIMKELQHHVTYSTIPSKRSLGTMLMRRGGNVTHALHEVTAKTAMPDPSQPKEEQPGHHELDNAKILLKAAQIVNSELRQQSKVFAQKSRNQLFTDINVDNSMSEIAPLVWNFFYLLTETTMEQRERDSQGSFDFQSHYHPSSGKSTHEARRLFNICQAMFIVNDQCIFPLHLLLADTVQSHGGSQLLIQLLNRLGVVASRTSLDFHKNAVVMAHAQKMAKELASTPSFQVASIDNIDKGSPHAIVRAEAVARSVHGTSYQMVYPQPKNNINTGDDFVPCSTSSTPIQPDDLIARNIKRDPQNLYRCLACRNDPTLRSTPRDEQGVPLDTSHEMHEKSMIKFFKADIIRVMEENEDFFMDELGHILPTECLDMQARIELLKKESCMPCEIECAAVSHLAKCPVQIFRMDGLGRRYLHMEFGKCFHGVEPCQFLQDAIGFDLLISQDLNISSANLAVFERNIFRSWREMNGRLLHSPADVSIREIILSDQTCDDAAVPPQRKKVKSHEFYRERSFGPHSYEESHIRATLPNLAIKDFDIQPIELMAVDKAKKTILQYLIAKEVGKISMPPMKVVVAGDRSAPEKSVAVYLGVLNEHADNIGTIKDTLEILQKQLSVGVRVKHLIVVGDGKTYGHLKRIKQEYVNEMEWLIPFPGDWHIMKNLQPVLMKAYWHAGLQELAVQNHKGATLTSLASCSHFKRTHQFFLSAWEAMFRSQLKAFSRSEDLSVTDPVLQDKLNHSTSENDISSILETMEELWQSLDGQAITVQFQEFVKKQGEQDGTYKLWSDFVHRDALGYILLYLSIRTGDWNLRVAALKMIGPLFHSFDRPMYLRLIPGHLADLLQMPSSIVDHLRCGGFVVSVKGRRGQHIALDEAHESLINRDVKMALHKADPLLMDKLALYLPYRAMGQQRLREQLLPSSGDETRQKNANMVHMDDTIKVYMNVLSSTPLSLEAPRHATLSTLVNGCPADDVQRHDLATFYETGKEDMKGYITTRILHEPSTQAPRRRNALRTFLPKSKKKVIVNQKERNKKIVTACLRRQLAYAKKTGNPICELGQYIKLPLAIAKADGTMYKGNKAVTTGLYKKRYDGVFRDTLPKDWKPECVILEGMFMINTAPLGCHKVFSDYLRSLVSSFILFHVHRDVKEIHVVFDHPHRNGISPKDLERYRRDDQQETGGDAMYTSISADSPLPSNWRKFLAKREHKRLLVNFLCAEIPHEARKSLRSSQAIITAGGLDGEQADGALIGDASGVTSIAQFSSNHEESDSRVWAHANQTTLKRIMIYSPDTDTYHVGLPLMTSHFSEKEVIVQLSLKIHNHMYCDMNAFVQKLDTDPDLENIPKEKRGLILHIVYIASGCDYTSFFSGCGKSSFYGALYQHAKFITSGLDALGTLSDVDEDLARLAFFRLVGCVYFKRYFSAFNPVKTPLELFKSVLPEDRDTELMHHEKWLNTIREVTWARAESEEGLLPSNDALLRHWQRCLWVLKLWAQAPLSLVRHPKMEQHGYNENDGKVSISWDSDRNEEAVQVNLDWMLKGCKCKTGCSSQRCKCLKGDRACGPGCECTNCLNPRNNEHAVGEEELEQVMECMNEVEVLQTLNADQVYEEVSLELETDVMVWEEETPNKDDYTDD